ncbi:hypothetical protein EDD68_12811 [Melghiribacillus thermohalophilus]|uniref:DUF7916 domain-containing protein n=1 Tax=Melghiribacillus thermohalophilus TaxID=1324956 RepID=A0A4R3MPU7_9BACI|nr:haloacid dehalogenase-like hydrolase [Melghiribacillus thermohalophilus]TCT17563.1 hypothetical protein EDD68_12811 [Melghiribacillus thermohalophilus]
MKRLLSCTSSELVIMSGKELKESIRASEGRTILSEVIPAVPPLYPEVTNAELAAGFGADLLLLNGLDVFNPEAFGLDAEKDNVISTIRNLTGRPVGINLEPVDSEADYMEPVKAIPLGRTACRDTLKKAKMMNPQFICLTGNPQTGVSNSEIIKAINRTREVFGEDLMIIAGKMHGAGVCEDIMNVEIIDKFIEAGADVILLPSPGTVPGVTTETAAKWIRKAHQKGALTMLTIGTSQEGADETTIQQIALNNKMAGADIHHIGDAGFTGIAVPENIMTYSIAVRGKRHTFIRMAGSINR